MKNGKKTGAGRLERAEREKQIVTVAGRLFSRKGFRGTTTRSIARAAKISEATIFKHFKKKEDLYGAIIGRRCNDPRGGFLLTERLRGKRGRDVFPPVAGVILAGY